MAGNEGKEMDTGEGRGMEVREELVLKESRKKAGKVEYREERKNRGLGRMWGWRRGRGEGSREGGREEE